MTSFKLTPEADSDLDAIFEYGIDTFGVERAIAYIQTIENRFEQLSENPRLYAEVSEVRSGYRRSICGVHSIYYRITADDTVEIIAIIGRQDIEERL